MTLIIMMIGSNTFCITLNVRWARSTNTTPDVGGNHEATNYLQELSWP